MTRHEASASLPVDRQPAGDEVRRLRHRIFTAHANPPQPPDSDEAAFSHAYHF